MEHPGWPAPHGSLNAKSGPENGIAEKRVGNSGDTAVHRAMLRARLSRDLSCVNDIELLLPSPQSDAFTCRVKNRNF